MTHNPLAWIAEFQMCYSLTLVEGLTDRELLDRLGCEPDSIWQSTGSEDVEGFCEEAADHYEEYGVVQAGVSDGWTYAFEPESLWAMDDRRLAAASLGTRLISCTYNGNALGFVEHWVDGRLITKFESGQPEGRHEQRGEDPDRLVEQMTRVGFLDPESDQLGHFLALALLHEYTGFDVSAEQIDTCLVAKLPAVDYST